MPDYPDTDPVQDALNIAKPSQQDIAANPELGIYQQPDIATPIGRALANAARTVGSAATLPGDVYAGRTDPFSSEGRQRALALANLITTGARTGTMPAGSLGMGAAREVKPAITAYHGSPYDFDAFDVSKIGTGEGAQAYGHGLYFAENEGVAKSYRDQLTQAPAYLKRFGGDKDAAMAHLDNEEASLIQEGARPEMIEQVRGIKKDLQSDYAGKMYQVSINAHPDHFLDWDKPLSEQHPVILDALSKISSQDARPVSGSSWKVGDYAQTVAAAGKSDATKHLLSDPRINVTGSDVINMLGGATGKPSVSASSALQQAGIPGIRYLDSGSRAAGNGSRNYVVFDPKHIEILKKYGIPASAISAGTAAAIQNQQKKPQLPPGFGSNPLEMSQGGKIKQALRIAKT